MSNTLDFEGYYKTLGVAPTATADEVKRAFRNLARDLHPDRNPGKDTTAAFQRVTSAYEVLKDPKKRAEYNAEGARRMQAAQAASAGGQARPSGNGSFGAANRQTQTHTQTNQAELRMCARCGCLSAQLRVTYFSAVRGMVTVAKTTRKGGVYCPRCAMVLGLNNNLLNWLFGWWALPMGPPKTLEATFTNMVGGEKPRADNVNLLYRQAMGFFYAGHVKIAQGIIEDALRMAPSLQMRDQLLGLCRQMGPDKPGPRLRNEWQLLKNPFFWGQLVPVALVLWMLLQGFFSLVRVELLDFSNITDPVTKQFEQFFDRDGIETADTQNFQVIIDSLPVYAAPNTSAELLGALRLDAEVTVLRDVAIGGWAAVRLPDGTIGYTAETGLTLVPE